MSLVVGCDTGNLSLDDIFRLVSGIDVDGNIYIRLVDGNAPAYVFDLECANSANALDILRSALVFNDDGEYALNVDAGTIVPPEPAFCATYQTIYDSFTTPPSEAIADEQNTMVCGLVDDGVWAKLDLFYLFAQTTNGGGEALVNWTNPGTFDATAFNAPAFVALEGFTGDGASTYIDTGWKPLTDGVNCILNSTSMGCYLRTDDLSNTHDMGCGGAGADLYMRSRVSGGAGSFQVIINNNTSWTAVANLDSRGLFVANRPDATTQQNFKNKVKTESAVNSISLSNEDLWVLNSFGNGLWTIRQTSMAFIGGSLTQTDVDNLTDRFEAYMDSNGKGVIP